MRYPGTIMVEILPMIEAGLPRRVFSQRLETMIETATTKLVSGAGDGPAGRGP